MKLDTKMLFSHSCKVTTALVLKMLKIWEEFSQKTTVHAVADIKNARNIRWRIFWSILLLCCTIGAGVEIYRVFQQFYEKPVLTTYEMRSLNDITFPDLTICIPNVINSSKVTQLKIAPTLINYVIASSPMIAASTMFSGPILDGLRFPRGEALPVILQQNRSAALKSAEKLSVDLGINSSVIMGRAELELRALFPTDYHDLFSLHFEMVKKYVNSNNEININLLLDDVAMDLNQLFPMCYFDGTVDCNLAMRVVDDMYFHRCFVAVSTEPRTTIVITINLQNDLIWKPLPFMMEGVAIFISDTFSPFPDSNIMIPSGSNVQVQLSPIHYSMSKSKQYGYCMDEYDFKLFDVPYSNMACLTDCGYSIVIKNCGCTVNMPNSFAKNASHYRICQTMGELICYSNVMRTNSYMDCQSLCKPRCDYWQYNPSLWFMKFPSAPFREWFREHGKDVKHLDNFVTVYIMYTQQTYSLVSQEEALSIDGFISQIGGQVGLFLGASIISVVQLVTFFLKPFLSMARVKQLPKDVV